VSVYAGNPSWIRYRTLLAERFDLSIRRQPVERSEALRGHGVHVDEWRPDGAPRGTVVLVHGGGGHGRILAPLGALVAELGWRAVAPDLPGYGLTTPAEDFAWDYAEWPATVAALADRCDGPIVLFGLSVGGMTAVHAAQRARVVDGVIATTLLDMGDPRLFARAARWPWLGWASLLGFRLAPALADRITLPLALAAPMRRMSADGELADYFETDALLGALRVPARFFRTMHRYRTDDLALPCPLLLVHPGADSWTPVAMSEPVFERIRAEKEKRVLTNGSHLPVEQPAFRELSEAVAGFLAER
jgi:pimeloyl-ACP methyl ester carboxylesterase